MRSIIIIIIIIIIMQTTHTTRVPSLKATTTRAFTVPV
jgi:hypothetical protein